MNGRESVNARGGRIDIDIVRICLAGLLGAVLVVVLIGAGGDDDAVVPGEQVVALTEYDLLSRADTIEPRPYWVGPQPGTDHFELEADADGNVYVRYVESDGVADGALTVATYLLPEAQARLERAAGAGGALSRGDGFTALTDDSSESAYVVFDELPEMQVEVFSPKVGFAKELALSGAVTPLHWTPLG